MTLVGVSFKTESSKFGCLQLALSFFPCYSTVGHCVETKESDRGSLHGG